MAETITNTPMSDDRGGVTFDHVGDHDAEMLAEELPKWEIFLRSELGFSNVRYEAKPKSFGLSWDHISPDQAGLLKSKALASAISALLTWGGGSS